MVLEEDDHVPLLQPINQERIDLINYQSNYGSIRKADVSGFKVMWSKLSVWVKDKQILNDVCGMAMPGRLLAIMGSSGAGKSTLLNVLAGQAPKNYVIDGNINGKKRC